MYTEVKGELLNRFIANGFERTCDELQVMRDTRRMKIADYYIMKAILNEDDDKKDRLRGERIELLLKIKQLNNKTYAK